MSKSPKVSVIMSVYNGEKYLREAIESILNQTFTDFEFIIVNDGSTDRSLEIIESYDDERIKIINNKRNIGLTKSLNKALKLAKGEYIARQDADDISLPNRFEKQLEFFKRNPEVSLLGTGVFIIGKDKNKILGKRIPPPDPSKKLLKGNVFFHGTVMFKKEVIKKVGLYNEIFRYSQDYELWLRIAKYYKTANLPEPLYMLRMHKSSIWHTKEKERFLYTILAQKLARNEIKHETLSKIKSARDIEYYLNIRDKLKLSAKVLILKIQKLKLRFQF